MYDVLNAYMENGLKIVLHRITSVRTVSCGLWVKQGSSYEGDKNNGLSHLTEHILLNPSNESNKRYQDIMNEITINGVSTTKQLRGERG